jgi:nucleotide-binding universal stress UspA family protein
MSFVIRSIVHPTDFSHLSSVAFAHALRIAVAAKCRLHALHVAGAESEGSGDATSFPQVRSLLVQWGLLAEGDSPAAVFAKLGVDWQNVTLDPQNPAGGILRYLDQNDCDLIVFATHGREGLDRWLQGSVAETVFNRSATPTLFVPRGARGFVNAVTGDIRLRRVLVPVDRSPEPDCAIETARRFGALVAGHDVAMQLLHVGATAPALSADAARGLEPITIRYGNVVQTILDAAAEYDADLIAMATEGRNGILDALRGSTTERVIRHAPCPVLAVSEV